MKNPGVVIPEAMKAIQALIAAPGKATCRRRRLAAKQRANAPWV
jgi:hypothetical protein